MQADGNPSSCLLPYTNASPYKTQNRKKTIRGFSSLTENEKGRITVFIFLFFFYFYFFAFCLFLRRRGRRERNLENKKSQAPENAQQIRLPRQVNERGIVKPTTRSSTEASESESERASAAPRTAGARGCLFASASLGRGCLTPRPAHDGRPGSPPPPARISPRDFYGREEGTLFFGLLSASWPGFSLLFRQGGGRLWAWWSDMGGGCEDVRVYRFRHTNGKQLSTTPRGTSRYVVVMTTTRRLANLSEHLSL